jgi:ATPase subunit of ABC transporter with duplicated ATPase domains
MTRHVLRILTQIAGYRRRKMLQVTGVSVRFGKRSLFENVNLKFSKGCCYGIIGANGAGKSTFLKVLSGELEPSKGEVTKDKTERISVLQQNHFAFEEFSVIDTVVMGNKELYDIRVEKDAIYAKPDFSEADGMKAARLEERFAELDGWNAESDAETLLNDLGIEPEKHYLLMKDLEAKDKVKVLLAQALFGNPDILLLDEPTNDLDLKSIAWLEEFLINYENTVIVVSHDRYFLNKVCTHICDVDYGEIKLYPGNYDFWYESSQLLQKQMRDQNKKKEEKIKELEEFIRRFAANASKSKQATSRKKSLEKIQLDDIKPSNRKYPYINFTPDRQPGNEILEVNNLTKTVNGEKVLDNISFKVKADDKIAVLAENENAMTLLFQILMGEVEPDSGEVKWGTTITNSYFPKDNNYMFQGTESITDWLRQYSKDPDETYVRSFLGRMLFSGEEALKAVNVLSGGEKVRCVLSKIMLSGANFLVFDEPTNHLDMESITALNEGMTRFTGNMIFTSHDHQLTQTVANRIFEIKKDGSMVDKETTYNEYLGLE